MKYDTHMIKQAVSMLQLAERYGIKVRHGMCCCPFHGEKHPSMKLYPNGYHCFACGEHGDIISWVQKMDSLTFPQAVERLCELYGLSAEKVPINIAEIRRVEAFNAYKQACREVKRLEPKNQDEIPSEEFWTAVRKKNELQDVLSFF